MNNFLKKDDDYRISQRLTWLLMLAFIIESLGLVVWSLLYEPVYFMRSILFPLFLLIPFAFRLARLRHCWRMYCMLYLFSIFAYSYGCVWGAFTKTAFIDKVSHFISGFVFTVVGICLYYWQAGRKQGGLSHDWHIAAGYGLFFSAFTAVVWEICEFMGFVLFGHDSQNHLTTGVFDTMEDIIACMLCSVVVVIFFALYRFKKFRLLTGGIVEEFYDKNAK